MVSTIAMLLAAQAGLWAGSKGGIKGIDIIVKRQPSGSALVVQTGESGTVRFQISTGGNYTIEARRKPEINALETACPAGSVRVGPPPGNCFVLDNVSLAGNFSSIGRAAAGPLVTGNRYIDGNTLYAAGSVRSDGELIFSVDFAVAGPVAFVGTLTAPESVRIDARHLTFYQVINGPQAPAQTVTIFNGSASVLSYTAAFETAGPARWTASLSKSSGSVGVNQTDSVALRPPAGLAVGSYPGFLRFRMQTSEGAVERVAAVTLFVQPTETSKAVTLIDGPMAAVFPLPSGGFETSPLRVTNNNSTPQTYSTQLDPGLTATPAQLTLAPGETGSVDVRALQTSFFKGWERKCIKVITFTTVGSVRVPTIVEKCYWYWVGSAAIGAACTPTALQPVITGVNPQVARAGFPLDVTVKVFDNCGGQIGDFTAAMSVNNGGAESHIAAVQNSAKAITKGGSLGFSLPGGKILSASPGATRQALADTAQDVQLSGYLYPYFTIGAAGLTLKIDVESPNPTGDAPLTGSVDMPLPYDSDPNFPLLAQGAMVPNTDFEPRPMASFEVFSLFTVLPGADPLAATSLPFPPVLGDTQLLIDGIANVPLIRKSNGQVPGILPDLAEGTHIVNVLYKNLMSGAITFDVAAAAPSPLRIDAGTTHLYDAAGKLVTQQNPVRAGQIYAFYANGMGRMKGIDQVAGSPTPLVAMEPEQPGKLTIGDNTPTILYFGRGPGATALDQVNFRMDQIDAPNTNPGDVVQLPILMEQGDYQGSVSALGWFETGPQPLSKWPLRFDTKPGGLSYTVSGVPRTGFFGPAQYTLGSSLTVNVPQPLQNAGSGTQYRFTTWSAPLVPNTASVTFTVATTLPTVLIANFDPEYKLTLNGNLGVSLPPLAGGYYKPGSKVTVTGSCPGGASVLGLLVVTGSGATTVANPATITMDGATTVTVQCSPGPISFRCLSPVPSGLTGWWPLDELTGTLAKNLGSLANADGAYTNSPTSVAAGKVAGAYDFSNGGSVVLSNTAAYDFPTSANLAFSIDAWVRGTGLGSGIQTIVMKHTLTSAGSQGYSLYLDNGRLSLHLHTGSSVQNAVAPISSTKVNDGNWHLVAATVVYAANQGFLYLDGVPVLSFVPTATGSFSNSFPLRIGPTQGGVPFAGQIDEVEIFNRALPLAEVQAINSAGSFGKCKVPPTFTATITGCNATVASPTGPGPNYPANSTMVVSATPPAAALVNVKVTIGGVTTVYTSVPFTFALTGDATIVVECPTKTAACIPAPAGIVGWYPLDEAAGPTYSDLASNPADLTGQAAANPGKVLGAQFLASFLETAASPSKYNFGLGDFSVDFWTRALGPNAAFVSKMTTTGNPQGFSVGMLNGRLRLQVGDGSSATASSWTGTKQLAGTAFQHVVVTVSRTAGVLFFINGLVDPFTGTVPTVPVGSVNNSEKLRLGPGTEVMLDEVEIFNRVLTPTEAQQLYLADTLGKCKTCPGAPADAVASYHLESNLDPILDSKGGVNGRVVTPSFNDNYSLGGTLNLDVSHTGYGNALKFPLSTRPAILLNGNPVDPSTQDVTVTAYVKLDPADNAPAHHDGIWSRYWYGGKAFNYTLQLEAFGGTSTTEQMQFVISDGNQGTSGNNLWYGPAVPRDNQWHCIGFRIRHLSDGRGEVQMFMDGTFGGVITTNTLNPLTGASATFLGWNSQNFASNDTLVGSLDEVQIFSRRLSDDEVKGACGNCGFPVTVNTSPVNIGATVGLTPSTPGSALNLYTTSVSAGNYQATVSPTIITGSTTEYRLKTTSTWSLNGVPNAAWNNLTATTATNLTAAATFTANYDTYYKVTVTLTGCTNQNTGGIPATGGSSFVLAGSSFNTSIAAGSGNSILTATLNGVSQSIPGSGPLSITVNPVNGPQTIVATCGAPPAVTAAYQTNSLQAINVVLTNNSTTTAVNVRITSITVLPRIRTA